jgi:hypothetical protein
VSLRIGERVDPPKDIARERKLGRERLIADAGNKTDRPRRRLFFVELGVRQLVEPRGGEARGLAVRLRHCRRHRGRQQEDSGALRAAHAHRICSDVAQQPAGSANQLVA